MSLVKVGQDGFDQAIVWHCITKDTMVYPAMEGLDHFWRGKEIHVRNPEGL